ncbi:peptidoglycan editing factor PgeF [Lentibacillus lipolyticus]|nr:peptidoglycan editing factor PgeF [Lentibacillus lipolyticus]
MTEPFQPQTESVLSIKKWETIIPGLRAGVTTRKGGFSTPPYDSLNVGLHVPDKKEDVAANRQKLSKVIDFPLESWVSGEQSHKTNVHIVSSADKGKGAKAYETSLTDIDGLITKDSGVLCTAFFADCVPMFFLDPVTGHTGIAHAGWKGTVHGIAREMVETFKQLGTVSNDLMAVIGPCISRDAYEVDEHVIRHIPDQWFNKTVTAKDNGRFLLDLKQLNIEILLQQGVLRRNIDVTHYCTFCEESLFFSHRRDNGKTGRMLGFIGFRN